MAARDSGSPSEEGYSSDIPKERLSMRQYRASGKPKARECSHFTYSWDNHPCCLSCSLWLGRGEWGGFPCVHPSQYCLHCSMWPPEIRSKYMKAIKHRLGDPCSFKTGLRFTQMHGVNGPEQLCEFLEVPLQRFRDTTESSEEQEIAEVSEFSSEGEQEEPDQAYGREGPAGPSSCQDQGKGVASRLSNPPETSRVETPLDDSGEPDHSDAQEEAGEQKASDSVSTSGHIPRPSGRSPRKSNLPRRRQPPSAEAEPTSGLRPPSAEATSHLGPPSAETTSHLGPTSAEATSHLGPPSAEAKGRKSEALPRRYPRLTFYLDNKVPSKEGSFPPDPQGAGTSARKDREPRGATSVIRSKVVLPRKGSPSHQELEYNDEDSEEFDSEPDSPQDYEEQEYEEPVSRPFKRHRVTDSLPLLVVTTRRRRDLGIVRAK